MYMYMSLFATQWWCLTLTPWINPFIRKVCSWNVLCNTWSKNNHQLWWENMDRDAEVQNYNYLTLHNLWLFSKKKLKEHKGSEPWNPGSQALKCIKIMQKVYFSSCAKAKITCLWHLRTSKHSPVKYYYRNLDLSYSVM